MAVRPFCFDFDLIISDLAPIALLLQRAGRGWRHPRPVSERGPFIRPELAVLTPAARSGELKLPRAWTAVYDESLLIRTHHLLRARESGTITIPDDVQERVDGVYDETFAEGRLEAVLGDADIKRFADEEVAQQFAEMVAIDTPRALCDLHRLTDADVDEELIATRLGADSVRVLCCYRDTAGELWLDPSCRRRLPVRGRGREGRFTIGQIREVLAETIPARAGQWSRERGPETTPPDAWARNPWLRDLVLLPHRVNEAGSVSEVCVGDQVLACSPRPWGWSGVGVAGIGLDTRGRARECPAPAPPQPPMH